MCDIRLTPACYLYNLHENEKITIDEKINCLLERYPELKKIKEWSGFKDFFDNKVFVKISYYCKTFFNGVEKGSENKYVKSEIFHEEAILNNIYFYRILSLVSAPNCINSAASGIFEYSDKTGKYLNEFAAQKDIKYEDKVGRVMSEFFIAVTFDCVYQTNGHSIYKCVEIPL